MEHTIAPTEYIDSSPHDDDLAARIRLFKAELDRRVAANDSVPYVKGDMRAWALEVAQDED